MNRLLLFTTFISLVLVSCSPKTSPFISELQSPPSVEANQMEVKLNNESEPAHTIDFVSDESTTLSAWREFAEKEFKQKLSKSKGNYIAESVMISSLSSGPISIYSNVEEKSEGSQLQVWVKSGEDFVSHSSHPDISERVDAAITKFARQFYNKHYGMAITYQQGQKKAVAEKINSLKKEKESLSEDLKENKEEIDENKEEINELQEKINELQEENKNLTQEIQDIQKEQEEVEKTISEKQKLLEKQDKELEALKSNSEKFK